MLSKIINKLGLGRQTIYTNLDAEATVKLKKYLKQLKLYSTLSKDSTEVYEDIYALLFEKVQNEYLKNSKRLNLETITKILNKIGTPTEILSNNDIDVEKLIAANPLIKVNIAVSNFVLGENKVLATILRIAGFAITIATLFLSAVVSLALLDAAAGYREPLFYDLWEFGPISEFVRNLALPFIALAIFALLSFVVPFTKKISSNLFNTFYVVVFIIFASMLLYNDGSHAKRAAILINNYRSISTSGLFDQTKVVSIGTEGFKEVSIQVRVNQINDVPQIHIIKAGENFGASFTYPSELAGYGDGFLYANSDRNSLSFSYDAAGFRKMCGLKCIVANGSRPELYVYADENTKISIKYHYTQEMSLFGYGDLPIEIENIENLRINASSSNGSHIAIKGQNIDMFDLNITESAYLAVTGDFKKTNITSRDTGWLSMGFYQISLDDEFNLTYSGYDRSIADFAYLGDSTFDLYDKAVLMFLNKGDGEYKITKHSQDAKIIE